METDEDMKTSLANVKQEFFVKEEPKEGPSDNNSIHPSQIACESCPESFAKAKYLIEHQKHTILTKDRNIHATNVVLRPFINPF